VLNTEALFREQLLALLGGWRVAREKATVTAEAQLWAGMRMAAEANTPWLLD